jgi:3',5'-cyclic AMP phosphodiesterase CpdA
VRFRGLLLLPLLLACAPPPAEEEVTFLVTADTHFGHPGCTEANRRQIEAMLGLPGKPYPAETGGVIGRPRAILVAGDLTESGDAASFEEFLAAYGSLPFPLYEATGNHDRGPPLLRPVLLGVARRHGSLTYSFDLGPLRVICLDRYPDRRNLAWLATDLAPIPPDRPLVLFFHYPPCGPYSDWWTEKEKAAFVRAVEGRRVIAVFCGHWHGSSHTVWNGLDVYNVGSPKHSDRSFAVVRVKGRRFAVALFDQETGAFRWTHEKDLWRDDPV